MVIDLNGAVSDDQRAPQRKGVLQLMLYRRYGERFLWLTVQLTLVSVIM